ncbi:peptidoglycan-binding protein [Blastococcus sp. TF02A-26]|uniref:peptidoglycan-binding protein n=1 Tax=Blastococcus sp. TF02A-26 TaxID=2250577 RepID=UPI001313EAA7|nr:peptidoglycan-binding protein [Blastococcus sp. TF02A-26]
MSTAVAVLDVARAELGTAESPIGSNRVKYNAWFYGREVSGDAYPWCAVFVSWVAITAGASALIPRHAYTPAGADWFRQRGAWGSTPRVGAIVFYEWPGMGRISHVGIVETVHPDGSWTAIEGNTDAAGSRTGGQVMRQRRRSVGARGGFGYPAYAAAAAATPVPAPAAGRPTLRRGDTGGHVQALQQRLRTAYPAYAGHLVVDGDFGPATEAAVREFQRRSRLDVDGVVGRNTWRALGLAT